MKRSQTNCLFAKTCLQIVLQKPATRNLKNCRRSTLIVGISYSEKNQKDNESCKCLRDPQAQINHVDFNVLEWEFFDNVQSTE